MTSKSDEEVRQQCDTDQSVELALMVARPGAAIGPNVACVLAAEVRRLRESIELREKVARCLREERDQLREERDQLREELAAPDRRPDIVYERGFKAGRNDTVEFNLKRMEAERELFAQRKENDRLREAQSKMLDLFEVERKKEVALSTKLARVEAWYARTTTSDQDDLCEAMDELGNKILRDDPQPSAAPTPKGEPYNGY